MRIKEFLNSVCEQIKYKPIRKEISEEIEYHIKDLKEDFIKEGIQEDIAEEKAINQMGNAEEIGKQLNKIHKPKLDWKLLLITIVLLCFGFLIAFIKSTYPLGYSHMNYMHKYLIFITLGLILGIAVYFSDYRKILKYSNLIYIIASMIIIYTVNFGAMIIGIPHLRIGTIAFSVSEIAIPLYIISFVGFLSNLNNKNKTEIKIANSNINVNLIKVIILSITSMLLLCLIPSMTSAIILGITYLILGTIKIIYCSKNKRNNLLKLWGIMALLGIVLVLYVVEVSPHILHRLETTFNPESDPQGGGWVAINRKLIIESAQAYGEAGDMSNAITLFDEGTSFAFISILAHFGWIVSIGVVIAVILLSIKLIINAIKFKDINGKLLIIGISCIFILQSIFNILMNLNLWIEANFSLPFVSYGGTNLIINMMSLALILSIYRRKDIIINRKKEDKVKIVV